jgi:hypothetical protein
VNNSTSNNPRNIKSRLKRIAKSNHKSCDGRFCELGEHAEIQAIKYINKLENDMQTQTELIRLTKERKARFDALSFALEVGDRVAISSLMKACNALDTAIQKLT